MSAYFHLRSKERYAWRLVDRAPSGYVALMAEEDKETIIETVYLSDVIARLEQESIKMNLDLDSVERELAQPTYEPVLIAKGKAVVPCVNAQLEVYFQEQIGNSFMEIAGTVDFRNRLYNSSLHLSEMVDKLIAAAELLEQALEKHKQKQMVRLGQVVLLLIENKLKEIPEIAKELLSVLLSIQHLKKNEYQKLAEMIKVLFQPARLLEMTSFGFLQSLLVMLRETHQEVARMQEDKVQIVINQCHNSELKSNGDIFIQREGVISSDLYSAGSIHFKHEQSVCRGAKLDADDVITAKIVGGLTGVNSLLKAKSKVIVKKMYTGRVCIGRYCTDIHEVVEDAVFDMHGMTRRM